MMPAAPPKKTQIAEIAQAVVKEDPQLQMMLKSLIKDAIGVALYTMKHGTEGDRMQLMRTLTPHMLDALRETTQNERLASEQAVYERMRAELRGEVTDILANMPVIAPVTA